MNTDKYNIDYSENNLEHKPIFVFVNHKTALLCWAKIKNKIGKRVNVVTFDSHGDFMGGAFNGRDPGDRESYFGSKYMPHLPHFSKCGEFLSWDILNNEQNKKFVRTEKKFLFINNFLSRKKFS